MKGAARRASGRLLRLLGWTLLLLAGGVLLALQFGREAPAVARFAVLPDPEGQVLDRHTGLVWQRCPRGTRLGPAAAGSPGCLGQAEAVDFATAQALATRFSAPGKRWRLPTAQELGGIVDDSRCCHALDPQAFPPFAIPVEGPQALSRFTLHEFHTQDLDPPGQANWRVDAVGGSIAPQPLDRRAFLRVVRPAQAHELGP